MTKNEERIERLKSKVLSLQECPGCYQYLDKDGKIIYVGKAKNLKRRVSSYFLNTGKTRKTEILVSKIEDIIPLYVTSDEDALLLENSLIKQHQPKYNILLKDGKTYPSVCITNEYFPRVFKTRNIIKGAGTYYGPFSHQGTLNNILDLINKLYNVRLCRDVLTPEKIAQGKFKTCLYYHIHKCKAPCVGYQSHEEYMSQIAEISEILKGNTRNLCQKLEEKMMIYAEKEMYLEAESVKNKLLLAKEFIEKSRVIRSTNQNIDVFNIEDDEKSAFVNFLHVVNGCITQAYNVEFKKNVEETKEDILSLAIVEMRERYNSQSKEIVVPFVLDFAIKDAEFIVPKAGDKKDLLKLSERNVKQFRFDLLKQKDKLNPEQRNTNTLKELQHKLHLDKIPMRIECFDNSNIMGEDAVAGCVVFIAGKPSKADYKRFNIKTVVGPDDYASMAEVVYRKYKRAIEEETPLPDLIITDGGKGQMEVVRRVIEDELHLEIPIAGLAKDNRHRTNELLFGFPQKTIGVETDSPLFKFLTRIQDEVHRFAITFHREKRLKHITESELDSIKGIGEKTKTTLIKAFKSVKRIKDTDFESLEKIVGTAKAKLIIEAFSNK